MAAILSAGPVSMGAASMSLRPRTTGKPIILALDSQSQWAEPANMAMEISLETGALTAIILGHDFVEVVSSSATYHRHHVEWA